MGNQNCAWNDLPEETRKDYLGELSVCLEPQYLELMAKELQEANPVFSLVGAVYWSRYPDFIVVNAIFIKLLMMQEGGK